MPSEVAKLVNNREVEIALDFVQKKYGEELNWYMVRDFANDSLRLAGRPWNKRFSLTTIVYCVLKADGLPRRPEALGKRFDAYVAAVMKIFACRGQHKRSVNRAEQLTLTFEEEQAKMMPDAYGIANLVQFTRGQAGFDWSDSAAMAALIDTELRPYQISDAARASIHRQVRAFLSWQGLRVARHHLQSHRQKSSRQPRRRQA